MKNKCGLIRSFITCVLSYLHASAFQGAVGALGPVGIIGPSGHPVCTSSLILCARLYVTPLCLRSSDGVIVCFFSPHQGPQGDKGSRGETVRGAVLMNPCLSVLWAQNRILSKETAHHSASSCPSALFISYCVPLFVVTLTVTLSCCGKPVSVTNVGLLHVSELFKRFVERSYTA